MLFGVCLLYCVHHCVCRYLRSRHHELPQTPVLDGIETCKTTLSCFDGDACLILSTLEHSIRGGHQRNVVEHVNTGRACSRNRRSIMLAPGAAESGKVHDFVSVVAEVPFARRTRVCVCVCC